MEENSNNTHTIKTDMASVVFIIQNMLDMFFYEGRATSDLSTLVAGDVVKLIKTIWSQPNLKIVWDQTTRDQKLGGRERVYISRGIFTQIFPTLGLVSREYQKNFTIIDCFRSKREH